MTVYMTEEEQIDAIKKWWKAYGNLVLIAISIVLLSISAHRLWNNHVEKINQQASITYEKMMVAFSNQDKKEIRAYADTLTKNYDKTVYADAAHLLLAKLSVLKNKNAEALAQLDAVSSKMPAFKQIALLRKARLLLEEKSYDKALSTLSSVTDSAYIPLMQEIKGDIYSATGKNQLATAAYQEAISGIQQQGLAHAFLEMKSNDLAALTESKATDVALKTASL